MTPKVELARLLREKLVREAKGSAWVWLTRATRTEDEQDPETPLKPFPERLDLEKVLQVLERDPSPSIYIEKSRTMMQTWTVCGYCAHAGFNRPFTGVIFHSKDEDRAVHCVRNVKTLWRNSIPELRALWPLERPMDKQPYMEFRLANGSWFKAIPGDPDKIRTEHPTIVMVDEAAFLDDFEASFNTAAATRCLKIICLSSANEGGFYDVVREARPCPWPEYKE